MTDAYALRLQRRREWHMELIEDAILPTGRISAAAGYLQAALRSAPDELADPVIAEVTAYLVATADRLVERTPHA